MINTLNVVVGQSEALWQRVAHTLRRSIVIGELEPGARLKEPALAQRFGVSRLPVREALAQLEREGLVHIEPRRGASVIGVTEQGITDIYDCRLVLECFGIRRAADRIDERGLAVLSELIDQMQQGVKTGQIARVAMSDMAFHRLIIELSGNRALAIAWEPLAPLIETALSIADATVPDLPAAVDGHQNILNALEKHNADLAEELMRQHLPGGEKLVHGAIRQVRGGQLPA